MNKIYYVVATLNCVDKIKILKKTSSKLNNHNCEILVADGGSTDGTLEELEKIVGLKIISSDNDRGIYEAWNRALEFIKDGYVGFIGVDDVPSSKFISRAQLIISESLHLPKIIYGDRLLKRGKKVRHIKGPENSKLFFAETPLFDIPHQGCLHSMDLFKNGRFDPSFKLAGDLKFYMQYARDLNTKDVFYIPVIQVLAEDQGVSRMPSAYLKYLHEYKRIENELKISIKYSEINLRIMNQLSKIPGLWYCLKSVFWFFRGTKFFQFD